MLVDVGDDPWHPPSALTPAPSVSCAGPRHSVSARHEHRATVSGPDSNSTQLLCVAPCRAQSATTSLNNDPDHPEEDMMKLSVISSPA